MLFTEWNLKDALEVAKEEGEARGVAIVESKILDLMAKGYSLEQIKGILKGKGE
jgi:Holliday junction resolvasome RuvABC endonuclease subunit